MSERLLKTIHINFEKKLKKIIAERAYPIEVRPVYNTDPDNPEYISLGLYTWIDSFSLCDLLPIFELLAKEEE